MVLYNFCKMKAGKSTVVSARIYCTIFITMLLLLNSCVRIPSDIPPDVRKAIEAAGSNKKELLAVIRHYKDTDSEKLEAAYFLISNLPGHVSVEGHDKFAPAFEQTEKILNVQGYHKEAADRFHHLVDSIRLREGHVFSVREDLKTIMSEYLIENIDLAFEAYRKIPEHFRSGEDFFMDYVLPYRVGNEPLEPGLRARYFREFSWAYDHLEEYGSLEKTVCEVLRSLELTSTDFSYNSPPISNVHKLGFGNCHTLTSLKVFVLRSLGIPAVNDITPAWSNTTRWVIPGGAGHEWPVFFASGRFYALDGNLIIVNRMYEKVSAPKMYRKHQRVSSGSDLYPAFIDVTDQYRNTSDILIDVPSAADKAYLSVFSSGQGWIPVAQSESTDDGFLFKAMGRDIVYAVSGSDDAGKLLTAPFYLDASGTKQYLEPGHDKPISATLTRKYPPYLVRNLNKIEWNTSLNGSEILAANQQDFSDAVSLKTIENFNSSHKQIIRADHAGAYKYYRFISPSSGTAHLAGFHLLDNNQDIIRADWQVLTGEDQAVHEEGFNVIDEESLTFIAGSQLNITYTLPEPATIRHFQVQARNDDNHINPGDFYELLFWDDGWQSAGRQVAGDTLLVYEEVPSGALFWLRNHSGGQEENIFMLDEKGEQFWPGLNKLGPAELGDPDTFWRDRLCEL
jgi:hypothetical protein